MTKPQKQALASVVLIAVGFTGLKIGEHLHPDSNLLGGWGPTFGPIYWFGFLLLLASLLRLFVARLSRRQSTDEAADDQPR